MHLMDESPRLASKLPKLDVKDKLNILMITGLCIWVPSLFIFLYFYVKDYIRRKELKRMLREQEELDQEDMLGVKMEDKRLVFGVEKLNLI